MYYSIKTFADKIGVAPVTLRVWDNNGKLKPHHKTPGGKRFYSEEQVAMFIGEKVNEVRLVFVDGKLENPKELEKLGKAEIEELKEEVEKHG